MKRNYRSDLEFLESGFRACWQNATDLLSSAQMLLDANQVGISLSVSVLTMEEIGKMMYLDGLLFARSGDYKDENFKSGFRKHQWKLRFLDLFPFFAESLAGSDPRYSTDQHFKLALAIALADLQKKRSALSPWLGPASELTQLDTWKQRGFYANAQPEKFVAPREAVPEDFAKGVHALAWRFTSTVDFHLKDGNLERDSDRAKQLRAKLTENDHQLLENTGAALADDIFGDPDSNDDSSST